MPKELTRVKFIQGGNAEALQIEYDKWVEKNPRHNVKAVTISSLSGKTEEYSLHLFVAAIIYETIP